MPPDRHVDAERATDDDALARVRSVCAHLPEVEEAELQGRPLFRVRRRRFAIVNGATSPPRPRWDGCGRSLHVLADEAELEALRQDPRFSESPHHGSLGWVALALDPDDTDWAEVAELLEAGYRRAAARDLVEQLDRRPRRG
jgi:predicted DNA-binding protein (MmcQ/YjbR family)